MAFKPTDLILVMGQRGCGKSYLARGLQKMWPRRIIIDSLFEYGPEDGHLVSNFQDFSNYLVERKSDGRDFVLIYQFEPESTVSEVEFEQLVRCSYYFGNVQLVIEEVQLYSTPHSLPQWLKTALLTGRHQNLSMMFTSQRPGEIHKTIISQCAHIFVGKIVEGNDLRYVSYFLGKDFERLPSLPDRKFLYRDETGLVKEISNEI